MTCIYYYNFNLKKPSTVFNNIQLYYLNTTQREINSWFLCQYIYCNQSIPLPSGVNPPSIIPIFPFTSMWKEVKIYNVNLHLAKNKIGQVYPYVYGSVRVFNK